MRLLSIILILFTYLNVNAQSLTGGSGICVVNGNPNSVSDISTVDPTVDCTTAYNQLTGDRWKYIPTRPEGDRWVMESNGIDTNTDSIDVNGGELRIREAGSFINIDVKEIAPIQTLSNQSANVSVSETIAGSGDWLINMTETPLTMNQVGNDITINDNLGNSFTFSLLSPTATTLQSVGDIQLTEPTPQNYVLTFNETEINVDTSVPGQVSITNEAGVVKTFPISANGVNSIVGAGDIQVTESPIGSKNYIVGFTHNRSFITINGTQYTHNDGYGNTITWDVSGGGGSGGGLTLHGAYKNDEDAAANGCPLNAYYETDVDNTLGEPVGTIRRRKN